MITITRDELVRRLRAATGNTEPWDDAMMSAALIHETIDHLLPTSTTACEVCGGSGRRLLADGSRSAYNDCTEPGCDAAAERVALERFVEQFGRRALQMDTEAVAWSIHQRAKELAITARSEAVPEESQSDRVLELERALSMLRDSMKSVMDAAFVRSERTADEVLNGIRAMARCALARNTVSAALESKNEQ